MATNSTELLHDFFPMLRVYKDGRVERFMGNDTVPQGTDPVTGVQSKDIKIPSEFNLSARLHLPKGAEAGVKLPLLVYFHGGGFLIESAFSPTYHNYLNSVAAEANVVVVSVDYRLAPEHLLPAAYEDSWLAIKWVASQLKGDVENPEPWLKDYADFEKVYFGGDSAGANLAHQMALRLGIEKLDGLNLVGIFLNCPYFWSTDLIADEASRVQEWKHIVEGIWHFAYPDSTGLDDPLLNPEKDPNLEKLGCKKVLVFVAEKDVLRYRGWHYKETLLKKTSWGGEIEVVEYEGEDHVFNLLFPTKENAGKMMKKVVSFINHQDGE